MAAVVETPLGRDSPDGLPPLRQFIAGTCQATNSDAHGLSSGVERPVDRADRQAMCTSDRARAQMFIKKVLLDEPVDGIAQRRSRPQAIIIIITTTQPASQHQFSRPAPPPLLSRPVEDCERCSALAGVRNLGLDDPGPGRPDSHCNFGGMGESFRCPWRSRLARPRAGRACQSMP